MRLLAGFLAMTVGFAPGAPFAWASDGFAVSLPQLLIEARKSNPDLLAAHKRWEATLARVPQAKGLPAPRIGIEFEEIPRGTFKVNQATLMYQLIQSLPFPGKLSMRQKVAIKEAQMAGASFKKAEWDLITDLKKAYYDLILIDRQKEYEEQLLLWLRQAQASAKARYVSGAASYVELLRMESEVLEVSNEISVLGHRRQALEAHINHLTNRPAETPVGKPAPLTLIEVPSNPEELLAQAREHQPELLLFQFSLERAEAALKLSKRELLPDLETMVELRDPAMGPIGPWDLTLALVLPFWFWTKEKYGVKAALYDKDSAQAAYQGMLNEISRRIHENWHGAKAAFETASLYREGLIPKGQQAVGSALAAYQTGKGSFMELLDALRVLNERQRLYEEQLVMLEEAVVSLEQSVGIPLRPLHEEGGS